MNYQSLIKPVIDAYFAQYLTHNSDITLTGGEQRRLPDSRRLWTDYDPLQIEAIHDGMRLRNLVKERLANFSETLYVPEEVALYELGRQPGTVKINPDRLFTEDLSNFREYRGLYIRIGNEDLSPIESRRRLETAASEFLFAHSLKSESEAVLFAQGLVDGFNGGVYSTPQVRNAELEAYRTGEAIGREVFKPKNVRSPLEQACEPTGKTVEKSDTKNLGGPLVRYARNAPYAEPRVEILSGGPLTPYLIQQLTGNHEVYLGRAFEPVDEGRFGSGDLYLGDEDRQTKLKLDKASPLPEEKTDYAGRAIISGRKLRFRAWKQISVGEKLPQVGLPSVAQLLTGNDYGRINILYKDVDGGLRPSYVQVKEHPYMIVDGDMIRLVGNGQDFIVLKQEWGSIEDILQRNPHLEVRRGKSSLTPEYGMPKSLREVLDQTRELTVKEIEEQATPNHFGESNHSKRRIPFQYLFN